MPISACCGSLINGSMLISISMSGRFANTAAAQKIATTAIVVTMWAT